MQPDRNAVIARAREYLGTPYRHQGRAKGLGMDCVGLPICVGEDLGLRDKLGSPILKSDHLNYPPRPIADVSSQVAARLEEKPRDWIKGGDVVTIKVGRYVSHLAIVTDLEAGLGLIHAYAGGPCMVAEHRLDLKWKSRIYRAFYFPEIGS
jgi:cell wall-associated NlpC family hydrolase